MNKRETIFTVLLLGLISVCIYGLQILLFHDLRNTEFYILQDLAFIPISIAITTVVVGNIMDSRSKKEAAEKAGMLRSVFFSDIGRTLIAKLNSISESSIVTCLEEDATIQEKQDRIRSCSVKVDADGKTYEYIRSFLNDKKHDLITLSGNNDLMDQDDFTQMLGGIFHLLDEFELRGSFDELNTEDISHMNDDFAKVLVLLAVNSAANAEFQQKNFPDFYRKARGRIKSK